MIVKGSIGGKTTSFEEFLQSISQSPSRNKILKTIHTSGYLTNGVILSRLLPKEKHQIDRTHYDLVISDSEYKDTEPFDILERAVPKYLRIEIKFARVIGGDDKLRLIRLKGGGITNYVDEKVFWQFFQRIDQLMSGRCLLDTSWWFSKKNHPVVVLDESGFNKGKLLGTIAPATYEPKEEMDFGKAKLKRKQTKNGISYERMKVLEG